VREPGFAGASPQRDRAITRRWGGKGHASGIAGHRHHRVGVGGCVGYFYFANQFLDKVLFPAKGKNAGRNINRANQIRPWLFLFPAMFALGLYLAYPVFETLRLSLTDRDAGAAPSSASPITTRCSASPSSGRR
jgi:hypothetical protein